MAVQPLYKIPVGSELNLDRQRWRVVGKDPDGYAVEDYDGCDCTVIPFKRIDDAIKSGDCKVITPVKAENHRKILEFTGGFDHVEQLSPSEQSDIRARLGLVRAMDWLEAQVGPLTQRYLSRTDVRKRLRNKARELSKEPKLFHNVHIGSKDEPHSLPQGRTLQEMRNTYLAYDRNPIALMRRHNKKGPQGEDRKHLSGTQERFIDYVMSRYHSVQQPKLGPIYDISKAIFNLSPDDVLQGFRFPSITTVRTRAAMTSKYHKSIGEDGKRNSRNKLGAGSTDIRSLMFGERGEMDQVYLSIFTDDKGAINARRINPGTVGEELKRDEVRRLWLHFMIDVATRMPLAWIVSESADADHSIALLRMATRDKTREKVRYNCKHDAAPATGLMFTLADNGTATRNAEVYAAQLGLQTAVKTARAYNSADKPFVERPFGTLQWQVLNFQPGYTGSRPGELSNYDGKKNAAITPNELYGALTRYFIDEYPHKPHNGTGMFGATPSQKLDEVLKAFKGIDVPSQEQRRLHLGITEKVTTTSEGVKVRGIPYNSTELQKATGGTNKPVTVYLDPDDLRSVGVTFEGSQNMLEANLSMTAFADLTLSEALDVMQDAVEANPKKREIDRQSLEAAIKRRAQNSKYFPDSDLPSSYLDLETLRSQADALANVEFVPMSRAAQTTPPGQVMRREASTTPQGADHATSNGKMEKADSGELPPVFKPITESRFE